MSLLYFSQWFVTDISTIWSIISKVYPESKEVCGHFQNLYFFAHLIFLIFSFNVVRLTFFFEESSNHKRNFKGRFCLNVRARVAYVLSFNFLELSCHVLDWVDSGRFVKKKPTCKTPAHFKNKTFQSLAQAIFL